MGSILNNIHSPEDVKELQEEELPALCDEIRECIIDTVSNNGGHLASNLGVVELTVALLRVYSPPADSIVWDVGHQSYTYKLLTGRSREFSGIRRENGLSGYPSREEGDYDCFSTGHSSASISAALGISEANCLQGKDDFVVAVIGDGALTGGLAYEALNNAGRIHRNFIVILNDNDRSISKSVGSLAKYLTHIRTAPKYLRSKKRLESSLGRMIPFGKTLTRAIRRVKRGLRKMFYPSNLFENFGFSYYGPFDGHNIDEMVKTFNSAKMINKPVLLHICTDKGKGYRYAEEAPGLYHGPSSFDRRLGIKTVKAESFSQVFGDKLCELAVLDKRICAITAAMEDGTCLNKFRSEYRARFYDVGIAEEHAVTFAGGLAAKGMLPVFAVYSTFLQRAYDQLIHDAALQGFKIILAIDRAGVVGEDGKTHQGVFDPAYLRTVPGATLYSPSFYDELENNLTELVKNGGGLCAVRYPRGKEMYKPVDFKATGRSFDVYGDKKASCAIVTYGRLFSSAAKALEKLQADGMQACIIKLNRIIPLDKAAILSAMEFECIYFYEEALRFGGVGEHFGELLQENEYRGKYMLHGIEDPFIPHASMENSLKALGFSTEDIYKEIKG